MSRWEFTAKYNPTASHAETMRVSELLDLADDEERAAWKQLSLGYTETLGNSELRESIANTYAGLSAQDVLCFSGAEEGIFVTMNTLLSPDDHAIVITPTYQTLESIPVQLCQVSGIALRAEDDWNLDLDELEQVVTPRTRLIVLNLPNNPTGKVLGRASYDRLLEIARRRNIFVFC
jgi:aspartate/methionine/tyrosine aminotransferase